MTGFGITIWIPSSVEAHAGAAALLREMRDQTWPDIEDINDCRF